MMKSKNEKRTINIFYYLVFLTEDYITEQSE